MGDILVENKKLYNFELKFLQIIGIINFIAIILFLLGFLQTKPFFILEFNMIFKVILAVYLIYRFNDYRKHPVHFTELDRKICFSTGISIILISFMDFITYNIDYIRNNYILPYSEPIINQIKMSLKNLNL
jgi:hypothetical protein